MNSRRRQLIKNGVHPTIRLVDEISHNVHYAIWKSIKLNISNLPYVDNLHFIFLE